MIIEFIIIIIIIIIVIISIISILIYYKYKYKYKHQDNNIPKKIYITSKTKSIPEYVINNWKQLNPTYEIIHYDNEECIKYLKNNFTQEHVDIFNYIKDGPIKADFFRVCVIYMEGGVYSDIDIKLLVPIDEFVEKDVNFLTCISYMTDGINPHFIIAPPKHKILKKCIDKYLEFYRTKKTYGYWDWSIVHIMADIIYKHFGYHINNSGLYYDNNNNKIQLLKEVWNDTSSNKNLYCEYKDKIILYNRHDDYDSDNHTY